MGKNWKDHGKKIYEKKGIRIEELDDHYQISLSNQLSYVCTRGVAQIVFEEKEMQELVGDLVKLKIGRKRSEEKVKLIQRRKSYIRFMDLAKTLQSKLEVSNEKICDALVTHFLVMDEMQAFGSQRNANLAYESLQQVKEDLRRKE